jgi:hypothetical protein
MLVQPFLTPPGAETAHDPGHGAPAPQAGAQAARRPDIGQSHTPDPFASVPDALKELPHA